MVSAAPKQEVAQGLLMLENLSQEPPREEPLPEGGPQTVPLALLTDFFLRFRQDFPQAAARVLPALYDASGNLTPGGAHDPGNHSRQLLPLPPWGNPHGPGPLPGGGEAGLANLTQRMKRT